MSNSRKTTMVLVLSANLVLSAGLCWAIWAGDKTGNKTAGDSGKTGASANQSNAVTAGGEINADGEHAVAITRQQAGMPRAHIHGTTRAQYSDSALWQKLNSKAGSSTSHVPAEVPVAELPPPPSPVEVARENQKFSHSTSFGKVSSIKVTGLIGNKAVLSLRKSARRDEHPEVICLAPGEETWTRDNTEIAVESVEGGRVTIKLGGNRLIKLLPDIR